MDVHRNETTDPERLSDAPRLTVDEVIDAAVDSYPLTALPPGFSARTLARLGPSPAVARPRLRLLDLALPLALAGLALVALMVLTLVAAVDPALPVRLQAARMELWAALLPGVPVPGVAVWTYGAALLGMVVLGVAAWMERGGDTERA